MKIDVLDIYCKKNYIIAIHHHLKIMMNLLSFPALEPALFYL